VGPAADLYSLGCALVFALTGSVPFPAATTLEKVRRHRTDPPPDLAGAPAEVTKLVHRLLAKSPAARPASAAEVRDLLTEWATEPPAAPGESALALADAPGTDASLWAAAPGDDLPDGMSLEELPCEDLPLEEIPEEVYELPPEEPERPAKQSGCAGPVVLLVALCACLRWM
jgi:serine/threonine-protein kinase